MSRFKVGEIVRHGGGCTALFKIRIIYPNHGGDGIYYYFGDHCMGGQKFSYEKDLEKPSAQDLEVWEENKDWRK